MCQIFNLLITLSCFLVVGPYCVCLFLFHSVFVFIFSIFYHVLAACYVSIDNILHTNEIFKDNIIFTYSETEFGIFV